MAKKNSMVDDVIGDVKKAAGKIVAAATGAGQLERIVPVPQIDTYSELPFGLVEKQGVLTGTRPKPRFPDVAPAPAKKKAAPGKAAKKAAAAKKPAKGAAKKAVKKSAPAAKKKSAKKRG